MTPEGQMWIVSSSFQTENCWTNLGRQPITHVPYRCKASALEAYLSLGLTTGAFSEPTGSRRCCLMFGASLGTVTTCCGAVAERHRTAAPLGAVGDGLAGCKAEARALLRQTRMAIFASGCCGVANWSGGRCGLFHSAMGANISGTEG